MTDTGTPGTPEPVVASGETVQEVLADAANETTVTDGGETAEAKSPEQLQAELEAARAKLKEFETERPLWLKGKEQLQQEREEKARLQGQVEALTERSRERATDSTGPKVDQAKINRRLAELETLASEGNEDAAILLENHRRSVQAEQRAALTGYPEADQTYLQRLMDTGQFYSLEAAALALEGARAREVRTKQSQTEAAVKAEGERRALETAPVSKPAVTMTRPVGAKEVGGIVKMSERTWSQKMDALNPHSKEAKELAAKSDPWYEGPGKIIVQD